MADLKRQILRNTVTGWLATVIRILLSLVMVPFLLKHLGKEGYGLIALLTAVTSISVIADMGLRSALGRELTERVAKKDTEGFNELASTAFFLYAIMGCVLAAALWVFSPHLVIAFTVPTGLVNQATLLLRTYGCFFMLISFINPVFTSGISSYHRFDILNNLQMLGGIITNASILIVLSFATKPFVFWALTMAGATLLIVFCNMYAFKRCCTGGSIHYRYINCSRLKSLSHLGGYMYVFQITQLLSEKADPFIISWFFGPGGVACYHPGGKLSQLARPVVLTLVNQVYPVTTKHHVDKDVDAQHKLLVYGTKYTLLLGSLFASCIYIFALPFCRIWLEDSLGDGFLIAAKIMMYWAVVDLMVYAAGTQWPTLLGMKRLNFLVWTQAVFAVMNVVGSVIIVGYTEYGIVGVMFATMAIQTFRRPVMFVYICRTCGLSMKHYFTKAYLTPIITLAFTLLAAHIMKISFTISSFITLTLCIVATGCFWLAATWFIGLKRNERATIIRYITGYLNVKHATSKQ